MKFKPFIVLLRPQQWVKNLLVFIPWLLSHRTSDTRAFLALALGALAFCFISSTAYVLNDLLDVESDRRHHSKKHRPLASGEISKGTGVGIAGAMLLASAGLGLFAGDGTVFIFSYLAINILYSFYFKKVVMADILLLSSFYIIRILYGGAVSHTVISYWLLSFSFFSFLSLAILKRYAELNIQYKKLGATSSSGRGYHIEDLPILQSLGVGTGLISVLLLGLYIHLGEGVVLYSEPRYLWGIEVLMLYWISRIWFFASRAELEDDPVKFTVKDRVSLGCALLSVILAVLAK